MGCVGFVFELVVVICGALGVVCNALLLASCHLFSLDTSKELKKFIGIANDNGNQIDGYLGLYRWDDPFTDGGCTNVNNNDTADQLADGWFRAAQISAVIAICFGFLFTMYVVFQQYWCPLPGTQVMLDVCGTLVTILLALVYLLLNSEFCSTFTCNFDRGGSFLILAHLFYFAAAILSRCMRDGRRERAKKGRGGSAKHVGSKNDNGDDV